jgi:zinc transport system substrate-binding protein
MRKTLFAAAVSPLALALPAQADGPSVAADIAPVHSLVAKVMDGVGSPNLIVQPGASPHGYSLRPADAEALQNADIVFWVSDALAPSLNRSINSLAGEATLVELIDSDGTTRLDYREDATLAGDGHGDHGDDRHAEHGQGGEHDHDGHDHGDEHAHGEAEAHGHDHAHESGDHDHADAHGDHGHDHGHDHSGLDTHAWLDPQNAAVWVDVIADRLAELDPDNASAYAENATEAQDELAALTREIDGEIAAVRGTNYIVFHDAYQYFGHRFDVPASGAIRLGDASEPSPARIEELRELVAKLNVACVFAEPQFNRGMVEAVFEETQADIGVLDPLGSSLEPGPDMYPQLLRNLSDNLTSCLAT